MSLLVSAFAGREYFSHYLMGGVLAGAVAVRCSRNDTKLRRVTPVWLPNLKDTPFFSICPRPLKSTKMLKGSKFVMNSVWFPETSCGSQLYLVVSQTQTDLRLRLVTISSGFWPALVRLFFSTKFLCVIRKSYLFGSFIFSLFGEQFFSAISPDCFHRKCFVFSKVLDCWLFNDRVFAMALFFLAKRILFCFPSWFYFYFIVVVRIYIQTHIYNICIYIAPAVDWCMGLICSSSKSWGGET